MNKLTKIFLGNQLCQEINISWNCSVTIISINRDRAGLQIADSFLKSDMPDHFYCSLIVCYFLRNLCLLLNDSEDMQSKLSYKCTVYVLENWEIFVNTSQEWFSLQCDESQRCVQRR